MTGTVVRVAAQAKLNLHLRVLAREESGYHSLETIFHRIDLADEVTVTVTNGERSIDVEGANTGESESNLAYRAADAYSRHCGWPRGFKIELTRSKGIMCLKEPLTNGFVFFRFNRTCRINQPSPAFDGA